MKRLVIACTLLATVVGCESIAENRKVTVRRTGVADVSSASAANVTTLWWRARDTGNADSPWNAFVPPPAPADPIDQDLKFFENNVIRWPKKLRPAYNPKPLNLKGRQLKTKKKEDAVLHKKLRQPLVLRNSEVY